MTDIKSPKPSLSQMPKGNKETWKRIPRDPKANKNEVVMSESTDRRDPIEILDCRNVKRQALASEDESSSTSTVEAAAQPRRSQ